MANFYTRPLAQQDIQEVIDYYDELSPKLADSFLAELEQCYNKIKQAPEGYQKRLGNIRAAFLKKFPFGVYYKIYGEKIVVIAILHTSRNPSIWKKR
ncbi:type II toxin-antitoxin system RelE/ParE family toxin [Flavobacteriaceae bacterium]|nr:type II toxin-antitoxin system RelE/ParE family toxin [Flavobacteriaceae bacterium]MDB9954457.1 type II toxin-antitoxin system RelE/ParE family toxin [Flavobacteriaceae bacterium]